MKVPEKLIALIKQLHSFGDVAEIQRRTGISRYRINSVIEDDDSSDHEVIEAVALFYSERKEILSDFITNA